MLLVLVVITMHAQRGFTLIEILVVIGLIAILAAIVLIAINPARQFAQANDSQRTGNVNSILNAVGQYMADHKGVLPAPISALASNATTSIASGAGNADICSALVPIYLPQLPIDPTTGVYTDCSNYTSGYKVARDSNNRITIEATGQITPTISVTR